MEFKTFLMAFDARVQSRVTNSADRLYYPCLLIEPDEGYKEARRLLQKECGDPYKVSTAYMKRLTEWPILKYDDGPALKSFYIFISKCHRAMKTIFTLGRPKPSSKHAGSSSEAPLRSTNKVARKRSENEMQRRQGCRLRRTSKILKICCRVCK